MTEDIVSDSILEPSACLPSPAHCQTTCCSVAARGKRAAAVPQAGKIPPYSQLCAPHALQNLRSFCSEIQLLQILEVCNRPAEFGY